METGSVVTNTRSNTFNAATAFLISLALSTIYLLFRNWLAGEWIRLEPGWTSIGRAWVLHLGAFVILGGVPFLLRTKGGFTARLRPRLDGRDTMATGTGSCTGERFRAVLAAFPLWFKIAAPLVAMGIAIWSSADPGLRSTYPIPEATPWNVVRYLAFMPSYLVYYVAFEFHYRGFLLPTLRESMNPWAALLLQSIPSTLIHIGLCRTELLGSLPGQLAFGWIALRGGSFWPTVLLHAITGITLDISILLNGGVL